MKLSTGKTFAEAMAIAQSEADAWLEANAANLADVNPDSAPQTVRKGIEQQQTFITDDEGNTLSETEAQAGRDLVSQIAYEVALEECEAGYWLDDSTTLTAIEDAGIYSVNGIRGWSSYTVKNTGTEAICLQGSYAATATGAGRHGTDAARGTTAAKLKASTYHREQALTLKARQFHCIEMVLTSKGKVKQMLSNEERRAKLAANVLRGYRSATLTKTQQKRIARLAKMAQA
jgi:hypothetical protein